MFGKNPIAKQALDTGKNLWVQEVFYTIQGEGPFAGQPATFIRLSGCNLRCTFCDTDFTSVVWQPSIDELLHEVQKNPQHDLVVITGGEPLRQNIVPLILLLEKHNYTVQIETAGTLWVPGLDLTEAEIIVSPKTSKVHPEIEKYASAYKYVWRAGEMDEDGLPTTNPQREGVPMFAYRPHDAAVIYLQALDDQDPVKNAANQKAVVDACMKHGYWLSVQIHKIVGVA
jgi:7-carboxy-7-deazaguanine synthase